MSSLIKVLIAFVVWHFPQPTTPPEHQESTRIADPQYAAEYKQIARAEALTFFDAVHMEEVDLIQLQTQLHCLIIHVGRDPTNCNAPRAYMPEVLREADTLVRESLKRLRGSGGRKAFQDYIAVEEEKAAQAMRAIRLQVERVKERKS